MAENQKNYIINRTLLCFELVFYLFVLFFFLELMYISNYYPQYLKYNPNQVLNIDEPVLKDCKEGFYICEEEWIYPKEPYLKVKYPILYWLINNQINIAVVYGIYFLLTQGKKFKRILINIFKKVKELNDVK
ncbi:hypothetical protein [Lutibacter sp.]|uniref:hypothetical protein n=1 Tax=Lutibacter sp. TaxID=1925666 RepID=UPI0034A0A5C8